MIADRLNLNTTVAALAALLLFSLPAAALDQGKLDKLYGELGHADADAAQRIAADIQLEQSKSGSPSMDLLLKRGRDAIETGDTGAAIEHLTALVDHAPGFADGWHARAIAYARAELYGPALGDLERALALNPRHFDAIASLGALLHEVGYDDLARAAYARVLDIHPHFEDVALMLESLDAETGGSDI
ncbi:hypothetical protein D6850_08205 [Roseovarius spongiae]|uniref:Uncharacterized protein n=2 Tax=Roseovarius spongiae TaxID=2320272 RepID=A0A3A8BA95_9RHOB|nr:hypothetical protein [Roseovarius spongiae]RKF15413.1 hypothetical protein D6850_08205 [Roseovarius spongiae]